MDSQPASPTQEEEVPSPVSATERRESTDSQGPSSPMHAEPSPSSTEAIEDALQLECPSFTVDESQPSSPKVKSQPSSPTIGSQPSSPMMEWESSSLFMDSHSSSSTVESQSSSPKVVESQPSTSSSNMGSQPPAPKSLRSSSPRPESSSEPASLAERLPDELLLLILAGLRDAATLLDSVSLVCRRWRRLARDPRAWAGASLRLTYGISRSNVVLVPAKEAWYLLHAPAGASLHLDLKYYTTTLLPPKKGAALPKVVRMTAALGRCKAKVTQLTSREGLDEDVWADRIYGRVNFHHFRALLPWLAANEEHLERLAIDVYGTFEHLERVDMREGNERELKVALAGAELPEALKRCSALRWLHCPASLTPSLAAMPMLQGLRELELDFFIAMPRPEPEGDWPVADSMPALRSLTLRHREDSGGLQWPLDLLRNLARAAPGLTRLSLGCRWVAKEKPQWFDNGPCPCWFDWNWDHEDLGEALECLPALCHLTVHGGPNVLLPLVNLPLAALAELSVYVWCSVDDFVFAHRLVRKLKATLRPRRVKVDLRLGLCKAGALLYNWSDTDYQYDDADDDTDEDGDEESGDGDEDVDGNADENNGAN